MTFSDLNVTPNPQSVCAVVLTFNAVDRLKKCISAVFAQTRLPEQLLVIDNHSSDGTQLYLESLQTSMPALKVVRTTENLGPAGGFHIGMKLAFDEGYSYLWLLDDDSVAGARCLENLLAHLGDSKDGIAWPQNIDETGRQTNYTAWRGELLPREVVERGGLPNKELFWGVEDTEYFMGRLQGIHRIRRIIVPEAIVHYTQKNLRKSATWPYYYRARNMVYYRVWVQRPARIGRLLSRLIRLWGRAVLKEDRKLKKTGYIMWGIWHGMNRRLGKTIEPMP